ncbi:hypothetical protein ACJX0J_015961, partial [Zea mays]
INKYGYMNHQMSLDLSKDNTTKLCCHKSKPDLGKNICINYNICAGVKRYGVVVLEIWLGEMGVFAIGLWILLYFIHITHE